MYVIIENENGELVLGNTQEKLSHTVHTHFNGISSKSLTLIVSIIDFLEQKSFHKGKIVPNKIKHQNNEPPKNQIFSLRNEAVFWDDFYQWQENHLQCVLEAGALYEECRYGRKDSLLNKVAEFEVQIDSEMLIESFEFHYDYLKVYQLTPKKYVIVEQVVDNVRLIAYSGVTERDARTVVDTLQTLPNTSHLM